MSTRRNFLLTSGAGLLSYAAHAAGKPFALPQPPPPVGGPPTPKEKLPPMHAPSEVKNEKFPPLPPAERVGFALVGLGRLTIDELLPAFSRSRLAKCVALVSGDPAKAKRLAEQHGISPNAIYDYAGYEKLAANKDVQAVYIVLPNSMHKEFTVRAAAIGKHVLCEKPAAVSSAEAQAMVDACKKARRKLMIAYRQQFEPNVRVIREMVIKKSLGPVKLARAMNGQNQDGSREGLKQWRLSRALAGGGALPDIGLYCLNGIRYMCGEEPYEVQATMYSTAGDPRFREVEESVLWHMKFPSGLVASCQSSYGTHTDKAFRFSADGGWFGMDPAFAYAGNKFEVAYADGAFENQLAPMTSEINQFAAEIDHMADCIRSDKVPLCPGEEGVQDHRIMEAIYQSARSGMPVTLARHDKLDVFRHPASLR